MKKVTLAAALVLSMISGTAYAADKGLSDLCKTDPSIGANGIFTLNDANYSSISGFDDVYGGHYVQATASSGGKVTAGDILLTIDLPSNKIPKDGDVWGGGWAQDAGSNLNEVISEVGDTTISFSKGTIQGVLMGGGIAMNGNTKAVSGDIDIHVYDGAVVEEAIIGGGKARLSDAPSATVGPRTASVSVEDVTITMHGGQANGIVGGNFGNSLVKGTLASSTGDITINIHGGTIGKIKSADNASVSINSDYFDGSVIGGSVLTMRGNTEQELVSRTTSSKNVNIDISGGDIEGDIYAGAVIEGNNTNTDTTKESATVKSAKVTVSSKVNNVYLGGAAINAAGTAEPTITDGASITLKKGADVQDIVLGNSRLDGSTQKNALDPTASKREVIVDSTEAKIAKIDIIDKANADNVSVAATSNFNNECDSADEALAKLEGYKVTAGDEAASVALTVAEGESNDGISKSADGTITKKLNSKTAAFGNVARQLYMSWALMKNDLNKRMGELRDAKGSAGAWVRVDAGEQAIDSIDSKFRTLQVGADKKVEALGNTHLGLAFSFSNADLDFTGGFGENNIYSLGAYGSWFGQNGSFIDVIGKVSWLESESNVKGTKAELDSVAWSLSAEFGHRFNFVEKFFVEPQVELTYGYADGDNFDTVINSKSTRSELDAFESFTGRAGLRAGVSCPEINSTFYAHASVVREFLGDIELKRGSSTYKEEFDDTWLEYGIGANYHLNDSTYIYGDLQRTAGGYIDEEWRGTLGLRYSF